MHGRLFRRVYLFSVGMVLLAIVSAGVANFLFTDSPSRGWAEWSEGVARFIADDLRPVVGDEVRRQTRLDAYHAAFDADVSLWDARGTLLASAGKRPDPSEPPDISRGDRSIQMRPHRVRAVVPVGDAHFFAAEMPRQRRHAGFLWVLAAVLGALALASFPFARAVTAPLERLTSTVEKFGEGQFDARSGIDRADEVGALARAFDAMAERIERLRRSERELLANVSHELRTPLSRIRVALELAEEGGADADGVRRRLEGIGADLAELEALIEDVLAASRLETQGDALQLNRSAVALGDIVADATARLSRRHPSVVVKVTAAETSLVEVDRMLTRRVLDNLLDNAAKYSGEEPAVVDIESGVASADRVFVEVSDRGIGASTEDLPRLFEPFFRTDRSRARVTGGVGLGLALCQRIVSAQGGEIEATSRDGGGLRVRFTLPAA